MKILVVEDNDDHFELIEDLLEELEPRPEYFRCDTMHKGLAHLNSAYFDICLMDLVLPDSTLEESVETLGKLPKVIPVIALTSINNNQIADKLLGAGIQDFIAKDEISASIITRACRYAVQRQHYVLQNERLTKDMQAFCHSLSHSFLSNIHQIAQVTELLRNNIQKTGSGLEENERWFSFLRQSTSDIETLVTNLRHLLSIEASTLDFRPVSLLSLLKGIEDLLRNSLDETFQIELVDIDSTISGDPFLLETLFIHLLSNGINYSESPAQLKVVGKLIDDFQIIEVVDRGTGMKVDKLSEVFEPFVRLESKRSGTGLGLAVCKKIVEKHNGTISLSSEYGQGTTVQVKFPT